VPVPQCSDELIETLARRLTTARRPVLYLGGGVITAGASDLAQALAHRLSAPVVCSLMALGAVPPDDSLYMGMLGMHAAKGTNFLLEEADLLLAIGARLTIAPPARWPSSVRKPRSPTSTSTLRRSGRSSPPSTLWSAMPQTSSPVCCSA